MLGWPWLSNTELVARGRRLERLADESPSDGPLVFDLRSTETLVTAAGLVQTGKSPGQDVGDEGRSDRMVHEQQCVGSCRLRVV